MADRSGFHALLGRALVDDKFRERLMRPEQQSETLLEVGIEPSDEVIAALQESIEAVDRLAKAFGEQKALT